MLPSCFITGTDTDAGKTQVTAAILRYLARAGLSVAGLKPIASGFENVGGELRNIDIDTLMSASSCQLSLNETNVYRFEPAIAPHLAAQDERVSLNLNLIKQSVDLAKRKADVVMVEGVGGWMVPLSPINADGQQCGGALSIESLAQALQLPVVMVVGMRLGCLNHALLTARAIEDSGCSLIGWVANHVDPQMQRQKANLATLKELINAPLMFEMPFLSKPDELSSFVPLRLNL